MSGTSPKDVRNADIATITRSGEDEVTIEMANGKFHEMSVEDVIKDWLFQHKKLQKVCKWVEQSRPCDEG